MYHLLGIHCGCKGSHVIGAIESFSLQQIAHSRQRATALSRGGGTGRGGQGTDAPPFYPDAIIEELLLWHGLGCSVE